MIDGYLVRERDKRLREVCLLMRHHRVAAPQRGRQRVGAELTATPVIQLDAQDLIRLFPNSLYQICHSRGKEMLK